MQPSQRREMWFRTIRRHVCFSVRLFVCSLSFCSFFGEPSRASVQTDRHETSGEFSVTWGNVSVLILVAIRQAVYKIKKCAIYMIVIFIKHPSQY